MDCGRCVLGECLHPLSLRARHRGTLRSFERETQTKAIVGNCCVKQFMSHLLADMPTDVMFASIKRVKRSPDKALHKQVVSMACLRRAITAWAKGWYLKTAQKWELTHKEIGYRRHLNRKIVSSGTNDADAQDLLRAACPSTGLGL